MKPQRGVTPLNLLLLLLILALAAMAAIKAQDAYQAHYRFACYENQMALDKALWQINAENRREVWDVQAAYSVMYPGDPIPRLVIIYGSRPDSAEREIKVYALDKYGALPEVTCPLDHRKPTRPVINYWFCWGKWHCLFNKYHSE
jgi:hypothetical protein